MYASQFCILLCILEICWPPSLKGLGLPLSSRVYLQSAPVTGRIPAPLFTHYGFWAGLLQAAHGHAMPPQSQRASLHGRISVVCFGSVGRDELDVGWGTDPQTSDFMYFYVFAVIYIIYLPLPGAAVHCDRGLGKISCEDFAARAV